jgi:MFS family permease
LEFVFYFFRTIQGVSVAAAVPSAIGILSTTFQTGERRNYAFVIYNATGSLGAVTGMLVGGVIGGFQSWEWVFAFAALVGCIVTVAAYFVIPKVEANNDLAFDSLLERKYVDWAGGAMITASMMILLVTLSHVDQWTDWKNYVQLAVSGTLLWMFVLWQRYLELDTVRQPLMKLSLFRNPELSASLITYGCYMASFHVLLVYASLL